MNELRETVSLYSPDEVNAIIRLLAEFCTLLFGTSVGVFIREMIFPKQNTFRQNLGFSILSAVVALWLTVYFHNSLSLAYTFVLTVATGFFIPTFKDWFRGKKIFRIIINAVKGASGMSDSIINEVDKELKKEEKKEEQEEIREK